MSGAEQSHGPPDADQLREEPDAPYRPRPMPLAARIAFVATLIVALAAIASMLLVIVL